MLDPKPGLVSAVDRGAHDDMSIATFYRSLFALRGYFPAIAAQGAAAPSPPSLFQRPRPQRAPARCGHRPRAGATTAPPAPIAEPAAEPAHRRAARYAWARLLARIYEVFPLVCSHCGAEMRIVAFITDPAPMRDILAHLGEPTAPPRIAPARGPPLWDLPDGVTGDGGPHAQPAPEYAFDQRLTW